MRGEDALPRSRSATPPCSAALSRPRLSATLARVLGAALSVSRSVLAAAATIALTLSSELPVAEPDPARVAPATPWGRRRRRRSRRSERRRAPARPDVARVEDRVAAEASAAAGGRGRSHRARRSPPDWKAVVHLDVDRARPPRQLWVASTSTDCSTSRWRLAVRALTVTLTVPLAFRLALALASVGRAGRRPCPRRRRFASPLTRSTSAGSLSPSPGAPALGRRRSASTVAVAVVVVPLSVPSALTGLIAGRKPLSPLVGRERVVAPARHCCCCSLSRARRLLLRASAAVERRVDQLAQVLASESAPSVPGADVLGRIARHDESASAHARQRPSSARVALA